MFGSRPALCNALPAGLETGGLAFEVVMAAGQNGGAATPPEWIQLTPRGRVTARDGRPFVFDPEKLAAAFRDQGLKLSIDFEHEGEFPSSLGSRPARAWVEDVEVRPEGLFGKVDWLPDAAIALAAKAYRYISPTFWREADGVTARLMKGAALVKSPALGMPAIASATNGQDASMLKDLLAQLGLAETASATDATTAIASLKAGDPSKFVPKAQYDQTVTALSALQAEVDAGKKAAEAVRCSALIDDAIKAGKIAPAAKEQYLVLAQGNYDGTKAAIDAMPKVLEPGQDPATATADPTAGATGKLSEAEKAMAANLGLTEAAYRAARAA